MNRLFRRNGIPRCFHELRDTWIEEARHSPIPKDLWEIISGHSKKTVSDRYGGEKPIVLAEANEKICEFLTKDTAVGCQFNFCVQDQAACKRRGGSSWRPLRYLTRA
jgi:hypothetical protein